MSTLEPAAGLWDLFQVIRPSQLDGSAACAEVDADLWFPETSQSWQGLRAKRICAGCPIREQCLEEALADSSLEGIWGGTTPTGREAIRRERKAQREQVAA